jgi:hypothetical protein
VKKTNKTSRAQPFPTAKFVFFADDTQSVGFLCNHFVNVWNFEIYPLNFVFKFFNILKVYLK